MANITITVADALLPALQSLATKANLPTPTAWLQNYAAGSAEIEQRTIVADEDATVLRKLTRAERTTALGRPG